MFILCRLWTSCQSIQQLLGHFSLDPPHSSSLIFSSYHFVCKQWAWLVPHNLLDITGHVRWVKESIETLCCCPVFEPLLPPVCLWAPPLRQRLCFMPPLAPGRLALHSVLVAEVNTRRGHNDRSVYLPNPKSALSTQAAFWGSHIWGGRDTGLPSESGFCCKWNRVWFSLYRSGTSLRERLLKLLESLLRFNNAGGLLKAK